MYIDGDKNVKPEWQLFIHPINLSINSSVIQ